MPDRQIFALICLLQNIHTLLIQNDVCLSKIIE